LKIKGILLASVPFATYIIGADGRDLQFQHNSTENHKNVINSQSFNLIIGFNSSFNVPNSAICFGYNYCFADADSLTVLNRNTIFEEIIDEFSI